MTDFVELMPALVTIAPPGGLVEVGRAAGGLGCFGDDDLKLAVDGQGRPTVYDPSEEPSSRWIAEHSSPGMFEVVGTLADLRQGTVATGSNNNFLLLTRSHLRGSVPSHKSVLRTVDGVKPIPYGSVYSFALSLLDIVLIDGNKNDIAVTTDLDGVLVKWVRAADADWNKIGSKNPWHKDNTEFAQALLAATIAVKEACPDEKVRGSALRVSAADVTRAFAGRGRSTFEFVAPG